jgi:hypothetical protein
VTFISGGIVNSTIQTSDGRQAASGPGLRLIYRDCVALRATQISIRMCVMLQLFRLGVTGWAAHKHKWLRRLTAWIGARIVFLLAPLLGVWLRHSGKRLEIDGLAGRWRASINAETGYAELWIEPVGPIPTRAGTVR